MTTTIEDQGEQLGHRCGAQDMLGREFKTLTPLSSAMDSMPTAADRSIDVELFQKKIKSC